MTLKNLLIQVIIRFVFAILFISLAVDAVNTAGWGFMAIISVLFATSDVVDKKGVQARSHVQRLLENQRQHRLPASKTRKKKKRPSHFILRLEKKKDEAASPSFCVFLSSAADFAQPISLSKK
jgi:hypothetical protein